MGFECLRSLDSIQDLRVYDHPLGLWKQECKIRWSSSHIKGDSLMKEQENVQMNCVKEQMTDVLSHVQYMTKVLVGFPLRRGTR